MANDEAAQAPPKSRDTICHGSEEGGGGALLNPTASCDHLTASNQSSLGSTASFLGTFWGI